MTDGAPQARRFSAKSRGGVLICADGPRKTAGQKAD